MEGTHTKPPTINQFLRELKVEVTDENMGQVARVIDKKPSKTTQIPLDQLEQVRSVFATARAAESSQNGTGVDEAPSPPDAEASDEPEFSDPACVAYREWEDGVVFPYQGAEAFRELVTWPAKEDHPQKPGQKDTMIKYRCPTGDERVLKLSYIESRQAREGGRGLGYNILPKDKEKEGVELIADLPGAPTMDAKCSISGLPLFGKETVLYAYFRDVLEAILMGKMEPEGVHWRERLWEAWKFEHDWLEPYRSAKRQLQSSLSLRQVSADEREAATSQFNKEWRAKSKSLLHFLRRKRTRRDILDWIENSIDETLGKEDM